MQPTDLKKKYLEHITKFLSQPYPFFYKGKILWLVAGLLFMATLLFSYLFEPFEVYLPEHKMNYFWISLIHALNPVLIVVFFSLIKIPSKTVENWNVRKEMLLIILFLFLVGIAQFMIRDIIYNNPNNWSMRYLYEEVRNTILIGTLFAILFTSLNFNRLNERNIKKANALKLPGDNLKSSDSTVFIETQVKSDNFKLDVDDFIFAKADGNYVELYLKDKKIIKMVKRVSLKELESLLKPFPNIIKTHRSYLVNINYINKVIGNAQGYKLHIHNYDKIIPVSRNMIQHFETTLKTS